MSIPNSNSPIVWIDCEMTGLDLGTDALVEIAAVVTDSQLNPLDDGIDLVIKPPAQAVEQMGDFVRNMHKTSGLIEQWDSGIEMEDAARRVLEYVRGHVKQARTAPLAGNTVGTDKAFLERDMPALTDFLHYRIIDVSSIKELARRWYPRVFFSAPVKHGGHRALGDILNSIDELRYYRASLMPEGEGPSTQQAREAAEGIVKTALSEITLPQPPKPKK